VAVESHLVMAFIGLLMLVLLVLTAAEVCLPAIVILNAEGHLKPDQLALLQLLLTAMDVKIMLSLTIAKVNFSFYK
jgi:hypothetical protein